MNFDLGRINYPSTKDENLIDMLRASRTDPLHNYTQGESIKFMGDVKMPVQFQAVQGGANIINPAIGTVKTIPHVNTRRRIPVKTENKRKDVQATEALWDIRNNTSLNNATKVMPNYYHDKLQEHARTKVRLSNTAEAMGAQYPGERTDTVYSSKAQIEPTYFNINGREAETFKPQKYSFEGFSFVDDTGAMRLTDGYKKPSQGSDTIRRSSAGSDLNPVNASRFSSSSNVPVSVSTPSYNPFLPQSSSTSQSLRNLSDPTGAKISYPDERMTRYSGERTYMSKGDRILMAADLARSDKLKERRVLQAQAHDALTGAAHAPRMLGSNIAQGINTDSTYNVRSDIAMQGYKQSGFKDTNTLLSGQEAAAFDDFDISNTSRTAGNGLNEEITGVNARRKPELEGYVPRTQDLTRQVEIKQSYNTYYGPAISQAEQKINNNDIKRKLYGNNDYSEAFGQDNQSSEQTIKESPGIIETVKNWLGFGGKSSKEGFKANSSDSEDSENTDMLRGKINSSRRDIHNKDFKETVKQLAKLLDDDSLSLEQRQAFGTDSREQAKEFIEDYTDAVKHDAILHEALNKIAERCIIKSNSNTRELDEDKFIKEILQNGLIQDRLDELKVRASRNLMNEKSTIYLRDICEEYDDNIISGWIEERLESLEVRKTKINPYYTERGMREDYIYSDIQSITKPVSMLTQDGDLVTRSILVKDSDKDKYLLLQRKEYTDDNGDYEIKYVYSSIQPEEVEKVLRKDITELNKNRTGDLMNMTFEDHVKLSAYIMEKPDTEILITDVPIHQYQRDVLDDENLTKHYDVISNVSGINDNLRENAIYRGEDKEARLRGKNNETFKGEESKSISYNPIYTKRDNDDRLNVIDSVKFAYGKDQKTMYKKFGEMM